MSDNPTDSQTGSDSKGLPYIFRSVMNSLDAIILVSDPDTAEILFASDFTTQKYGDCTGMTLRETPLSFLDAPPRSDGTALRERHNQDDNHWYDCRDLTVNWTEERLVRLHIAFDVTDRGQSRAAGSEADQTLKALSDASLEAIFLSSAGLCVGQNLAARLMFGYTDEEAMGHPGTDWIADGDRALVREHTLSGFVEPYRVTARKKDGTTFPCQIWARTMRIGDRQLRATVLRDITEDVRKEAALKRSEENCSINSRLFRLMADNLPDMLWAKDNLNRYTFANRAICEGLLGASDTSEPIGKTDLFFAFRERATRPDDAAWHTFGEICSDSDAMVVASGKPTRLEEFGNVKGEFLVLDVSKAPIFDENSEMIGTVGSGRIVTREKQLERERVEALDALRESRTILMDAQRLAGMGSWTRDRLTNARTWSDEMFKLTGLDRSTTLDDATVDSTIHPDDLDGYRDAVRTAEEAVRPIVDSDFRLLLQDGTVRFVHCRIRIEYDSAGRPLRHFGILHDNTRQREFLEEKLLLERKVLHAQKLESLGVLAGGIAHDFNNVLMGILGNADLALHDIPPGTPLHDRLEEMVGAASHAAELSRQMLAYSGMGRFVYRSLDMHELLSGMMELLRTSVSKRTILEFRPADRIPLITGDSSQIRQIVMNLVINASESYGDGDGIILLTTGESVCDADFISGTVHSSWKSMDSPPAPGDYVFLEVTDTGCGMSDEVLRRLFDPFFSTKFAGRGLGMAVLLGIVRSHGGMISVSSEPGSGSAVRVLFPVSEIPRCSETASVAPVSTLRAVGTILVVDDEETVRSIVKSMLERAGYHVLLASDGAEALEIFSRRREEISCVVLDLTMPRMSGEECLRFLREVDPEVRVLISSGYEQVYVTGRFTGREMTGFIQKPYRYADLVAAVSGVIRNGSLPGD
jgi:PAS domain S-box-containing protein